MPASGTTQLFLLCRPVLGVGEYLLHGLVARGEEEHLEVQHHAVARGAPRQVEVEALLDLLYVVQHGVAVHVQPLLPVTKADLAKMGAGGLCLNCPTCIFPNCGFGK